MRSISHWGLYEDFDREVVAKTNSAQQSALNNHMQQAAQGQLNWRHSCQSAANAMYQKLNFGHLD